MALTPEEKEKLRDALKSETADEGGAIKNPFGGLISGFGNLGSSLKKLNDTLAKAPAKLKDASTIKFKGPKVPNIPKAIAKGLGTILGEGFATAIASFGNVKVFKGILNLGLLGGSLIPFALALKKFGGVRFDKVLIGVGALTAIAGIARILGDPAISTFVFLGAAAIGALGLALMPFGLGLDMVASAMEKLEPQLASLANALDVALTPFVTGIVELFETLRTGIETIGFVLVGEDGQLLDAAGQREVVDAYEAARNGTGFWAKILAGVDAVVGGVTAGKLSVRIDKQDARQFVRMVRVLGRSSLAASPRFAVADLATTQTLFPNEETLLASPKTEARKLISLKAAINDEKTRILTLFASGTPIDTTLRKTLNQKLFEIARLNQMLGSVDTIFASEATAEAVQNAKNMIKSNVVKRGDRKE